ncbi:hypothetical protein VTK26DRAFT_3025 [Humicola hyalothermophila]
MPARLTPQKVHDESFAGLREAVAWLDRDGGLCDGADPRPVSERGDGAADGSEGREARPNRVERVVVLRRGGRVAYRNERDADGQRWTRGKAGALEALEAERQRALSAEEKRAAEEDIKMLRSLGDPEVDKELDEIERLIAGLGGGQDGVVSDLELFDVDAFVSAG